MISQNARLRARICQDLGDMLTPNPASIYGIGFRENAIWIHLVRNFVAVGEGWCCWGQWQEGVVGSRGVGGRDRGGRGVGCRDNGDGGGAREWSRG